MDHSRLSTRYRPTPSTSPTPPTTTSTSAAVVELTASIDTGNKALGPVEPSTTDNEPTTATSATSLPRRHSSSHDTSPPLIDNLPLPTPTNDATNGEPQAAPLLSSTGELASSPPSSFAMNDLYHSLPNGGGGHSRTDTFEDDLQYQAVGIDNYDEYDSYAYGLGQTSALSGGVAAGGGGYPVAEGGGGAWQVNVGAVGHGEKRTGRCKFFNAQKVSWRGEPLVIEGQTKADQFRVILQGFGFILDNQGFDIGEEEGASPSLSSSYENARHKRPNRFAQSRRGQSPANPLPLPMQCLCITLRSMESTVAEEEVSVR